MVELLDVFSNYLSTRSRLSGRAINAGTPDQKALLEALPNAFRTFLQRRRRLHEFVITGSIGNGNIARVPWVGVFNKTVCTTAQNGYYIVLLFAEDMSGCFLSLNQGVTELENRFTRRLALSKLSQAASAAAVRLDHHPEAHYGSIDLHSTGDLGRGYDAGAIESFYYSASYPPSLQDFENHFAWLLSSYDRLIKAIGLDLQVVAPIDEYEFQGAVLEKAASGRQLGQKLNALGGLPPPKTHHSVATTYVRDPTVAARSLRAAEFKCEINPEHWTFISRASNRPYVEAHHLIPMSEQPHFPYSIDVDENVVCLCATCHRLLHFGTQGERSDLIRRLYEDRKELLKRREILVPSRELLGFYNRILPLDA